MHSKSDFPLVEVLNLKEKNKKIKIAESYRNKLAEEIKECTFKPVIT